MYNRHMNDLNQSTQPNLPGFESYPEMQHSLLPDFGQMMVKRIESQKQAPGGFDPHKLMVQRKQLESGEVVDVTPKQEWPEKDVRALEEFCAKYGILGFNCGRMSPVAALAMLKNKLGIVDGQLDERVPPGYQPYHPTKPYQKTILHG